MHTQASAQDLPCVHHQKHPRQAHPLHRLGQGLAVPEAVWQVSYHTGYLVEAVRLMLLVIVHSSGLCIVPDEAHTSDCQHLSNGKHTGLSSGPKDLLFQRLFGKSVIMQVTPCRLCALATYLRP